MDEVDQIIIYQLKILGCTFENEGNRLNDFDLKDIVNAFIFCINLIEKDIIKNIRFDYNLNIAEKYKIASSISQYFQKINYKADIGYQTFLYLDVKEFRKLFLFLFKKLSECDFKYQNTQKKETLESKLKKVKISFNNENINKNKSCLFWNVNNLLLDANFNLKQIVEKNSKLKEDYLDTYWNIYYNIPTIIEWNSLNLNNYNLLREFNQNQKICLNKSINVDLNIELNIKEENSSVSEKTSITQSKNEEEDKNEIENEIFILEKQLESYLNNLGKTKKALDKNENKLIELRNKFNQKVNKFKKHEFEEKSIEELTENIEITKNEIESSKNRWNRFLLEYNDTIEKLKEEKKSNFNNFNKLNENLNLTKDEIKQKMLKIKNKNDLIKELEILLKNKPDLDRKFYIDKIFDIIKNVNKQDVEIKKIVNQIKDLQKEINNATRKANRSFKIVDEIFHKASIEDENYCNCYKMITNLNDNYEKLIDKVENIGIIKRQILKHEETIENEKSNQIGSKLAKVKYDLEQIRIENQKLENKTN